jgi:hypothetical protein
MIDRYFWMAPNSYKSGGLPEEMNLLFGTISVATAIFRGNPARNRGKRSGEICASRFNHDRAAVERD